MTGMSREPGTPGDPGVEPMLRFDRPTGSLLGSLLVATPALRDPSFERSVVLLVAHEPGGAMGVLFEGGPVQPDSAICVARLRTGAQPPGFQRFFGSLGTVDLEQEPEQLREAVDGVRVFAGYAGWSPGQLEEEIAAGSWFTFEAL